MVVENDSKLAVPVVVLGAGPAGLVSSLLLGRHGVPTLLVERREDTSILPKATGINMRTMEILRGLGLADQVMDMAMDVTGMPVWVEQETLSGEVLREVPFAFPSGRAAAGYPSPSAHQHLAQDRLDAMLLAAARASDTVDVRHSTELLSFELDEAGVTAKVRERTSGRSYSVRADYLVAADGARSMIRNALGVEMIGEMELGRELSILFEADIGQLVAGHEALLFRVANERMHGVFRRVDNDRRWTVTTPSVAPPTRELALELVRAGVGDPELEPDILDWQEWELNAASAERYQSDRVFLIGDAAHQVTPGGAMGANTAIQDAHNLAWKLSAVYQGWAAPGLLDTYEQEREPIGKRNAALSLEIWRNLARAPHIAGAVLGVSYERGALIPDGTSLPERADPVAEYIPCARPGSRAPHFWLQDDVSTIDVFEGTFTLLTADAAWTRDAEAVASGRKLPQQVRVETNPALAELYGIGSSGAVLVRPDGHVAWRTSEAQGDRAQQLDEVYAAILGVRARDTSESAA